MPLTDTEKAALRAVGLIVHPKFIELTKRRYERDKEDERLAWELARPRLPGMHPHIPMRFASTLQGGFLNRAFETQLRAQSRLNL
jgi:hypothetical protein